MRLNTKMYTYTDALLKALEQTVFDVENHETNQDKSMESAAVDWTKQTYLYMKSDLGLVPKRATALISSFPGCREVNKGE